MTPSDKPPDIQSHARAKPCGDKHDVRSEIKCAAADGNALFLILIAVALFAALSYAVTQSGRGGGGISREQAMIASAQIAQAAAQVEQAVTRLRVVGGCSDTQLSFVTDSNGDGSLTAADTYYNASAPADRHCNLFDPAGAGLGFPAAPAGVNAGEKWIVTSNRSLNYQGDTGTTVASSELMLLLPNISLETCLNLNRALGVATGFQTTPPQDATSFNSTPFTGSYTTAAIDNFSSTPAFSGSHFQNGICFRGSTTNSVDVSSQYWFLYVLLNRQP